MIRASVRHAFVWIVAGGAAFWLPFVLLSAAVPDPSVLAINTCPLLGLLLLHLATWRRKGAAPRWGWVLVGIYVLGPALQLLAWSLTSPPPPRGQPGDWVWVVLVSVLPPMTLWLATLDAVIFAVVIASAGLAWLAYRQRRAYAG